MRVSVILTCHNEELYIEKAIKSIRQQTRFDLIDQVIVVNDGSTDGSKRVLEKLAHQISQLTIIESEGVGLPAARNMAIGEARGDIIGILDGDDFWVPEKLEKQLPVFEEDGRIGLAYSDFFDFTRPDGSDASIVTVRRYHRCQANQLRKFFVYDAPIVPSTILVRRSVFKESGCFDETLTVGEDTEFYLRVAEKWRLQHVPGGLVYKRRRPGQITQRLDILLDNAKNVTARYSRKHPELLSLADRRMARFHVKVGMDCALKREWRKGIEHVAIAIMLAPLYWRAWLSLPVVVLPISLSGAVYQSLKAPWHAWRNAKSQV